MSRPASNEKTEAYARELEETEHQYKKARFTTEARSITAVIILTLFLSLGLVVYEKGRWPFSVLQSCVVFVVFAAFIITYGVLYSKSDLT